MTAATRSGGSRSRRKAGCVSVLRKGTALVGSDDTQGQDVGESHHQTNGPAWQPYLRFGAMIATIVMYVLTYMNVFAVEHIRFSEERFYMVVLMGAAMAAYMRGMYEDARINLSIVVGALIVGVAAFLLSQSQILVGDANYMRGMIPHHSIAILTSERAGIEDVRVRELADEIIAAQRREIAEMDWLIADIEAHGLATSQADAELRPVPSFSASPYARPVPRKR